MRHRAWLSVSLLALVASGCRLSAPHAVDLTTVAERTDYAQTGDYAEAVRLCRQMAAQSPNLHYTTFGTSAQGRPLPLVVYSTEHAFTPDAARRSQRPLVLIINCIHAGECAGKDACLQMLRDDLLAIGRAPFLRHTNVLIMPIFSTDGHERRSPYNRMNQVGPAEQGWRVTAVGYNLNRDFMKADAVEMQAWLGVWTAWQPDLLIDTHTTDGMDHQYDLAYAGGSNPYLDADAGVWLDTLIDTVVPQVEADGYGMFPYAWPTDDNDLSRGFHVAFGMSGRFSTGYGELCNRPAILLEAHSLKPYQRRVASTYAFLVHALQAIDAQPEALRQVTRAADERICAARGAAPDGRVPLTLRSSSHAEPIEFRGIRAERVESPIAGDETLHYTGAPFTVASQLFDQQEVATAVAPAAAYLVPVEWASVIERLTWHGVGYRRLATPVTLDVTEYRLEDVQFDDAPYEGRQIPHYQIVPAVVSRAFPAGTIVVPLDQPRARLIAHLLEPGGRDAFVAWGLLNTIFERKEYAEEYMLEPLARQMLADDPALRAEFERRLADDEAFRNDRAARLNFFYRRSLYWDPRLNHYPIVRVETPAALADLPLE